MITDMLQYRGFQILGDASQHFQPLDAICQFKYKEHLISISTAGLSKGACQTEVAVFSGKDYEKELTRTHTVEEAIEFVNKLPVKRTFTKEALLLNSDTAKIAIKDAIPIKGVLTTQEQDQRITDVVVSNYASHAQIFSFTDEKVFWFTDLPDMGFGILPENFRLCFMICPHRLYTSDDPDEGMVKTAEYFKKVYCDGMKQINTIDEMIDYLNNNYA